MSQTYYTLVTNLGASLLAQATALGTQVKFSYMAVGDANGTLPKPTVAQTKLISEKRRGAINSIYVDSQNPKQIVIEQVIPPEEGGWDIREIGVFDDKGNLIAVGNCPPSYKPVLSEGSGRTQVINMVIIIDNTSSVELKIDASSVVATRKYVDDLISTKMKNHEESINHPTATTSKKGMVQLSSATNNTSEVLAATPKAVKAAYDLANTANTTANTAKSTAEKDASTTVKGRVQLNSAVNSTVENQAATPKAVKTTYDLANGAVKKSGDTMSGDLNITKTDPRLNLTDGRNQNKTSLITNETAFGIQTQNPTDSNLATRLKYTRENKTWSFDNVNDVTINNLSVVKKSDHGLFSPSQKTTFITEITQLSLMKNGERLFAKDNDKVILPSAVHGYLIKNGVRDVSGGGYFIFAEYTDGGTIWKGCQQQSTSAIVWHKLISSANINNYLPVGIPQPWPSVTSPAGWLKCNGATFDKALYPKLAIVYPSGKLPDLRSEFIRGLDDGRGIDTGRTILSNQAQQIAKHKHVGGFGEALASTNTNFMKRAAPFGASNDKNSIYFGSSSSDYDNRLFYTNDGSNDVDWSDLNIEGVIGSETRPRNIAFLYIVKAE